MLNLKRPNVATIAIAVLAILALGGGTATAAKLITSKDIKNGSIKVVDLSSGAKHALKGQRGPMGPKGPAGPSALGAITPVTGSMTVAAGTVDGGTIACPAGQRAISGGFGAPDGGVVFLNAVAAGRAGWLAALDNTGGTSDVTLLVEAYCVGVGKAVAAAAPSHDLQPLEGRFARMVERRG